MSEYAPVPPNRIHSARVRYRFKGRGELIVYPMEDRPMRLWECLRARLHWWRWRRQLKRDSREVAKWRR